MTFSHPACHWSTTFPNNNQWKCCIGFSIYIRTIHKRVGPTSTALFSFNYSSNFTCYYSILCLVQNNLRAKIIVPNTTHVAYSPCKLPWWWFRIFFRSAHWSRFSFKDIFSYLEKKHCDWSSWWYILQYTVMVWSSINIKQNNNPTYLCRLLLVNTRMNERS